MDTILELCEIISGISAAAAILISVVFYRHGLNRERRMDTLKTLSEIRRKYFNSKELDNKEKLKYLNELEYFATGVNAKIYDVKIVRKMSGSRLIRQYENWAAEFIRSRRSRFGNKKAYCEYEEMIGKLKDGREGKFQMKWASPLKWVLLVICALSLLLMLTTCGPNLPVETDRLQVVATVFPAYDFARAASGELADVTLLLPPGAESHSYEPTPADILQVQSCDLFIYLGGESDAWVDTILSAIEPRGETLRMVDCVELLEEETAEGMQGGHDHDHDHDHDHEEEHHLGEVVGMDEHVWTAPRNAAAITRIIGDRLSALDPDNAPAYAAGAEAYAGELEELDRDFAAFFESRTERTIVFGDRFPLLYFAEAYDLDYYAAFPGCGAQTEPSAATVAFLTEKVRRLPAVWYIEFSNHLVADSIAEAAGVETAQFHTCHNVSRADLEAGETYLTLMRRNLQTLQEKM